MSDNKRNGGISAKGYYIALILCAAAIGITGYVYHRNTMQTEQVILQEEEFVPVGTDYVTGDIPVLAPQPEEENVQVSAQPPIPQPAHSEGLQTQMPVSGELIGSYSMEALSYNQTTRDWRVHNGMDIAAETGTAVCAAADGTVTAVYEDDLLGHTVVIRHEGGYTTTYSSLGKDLAVAAGDAVTMGQTIGYADCTALVESVIGSHVHFSVTSQGNPMDPEAFLKMGQQ